MNSHIDRLVSQASKDPRKGDYRAYEQYMQRVRCMALSSAEYETAVQRLAKALKV